jgi:hypothetical protein
MQKKYEVRISSVYITSRIPFLCNMKPHHWVIGPRLLLYISEEGIPHQHRCENIKTQNVLNGLLFSTRDGGRLP